MHDLSSHCERIIYIYFINYFLFMYGVRIENYHFALKKKGGGGMQEGRFRCSCIFFYFFFFFCVGGGGVYASVFTLLLNYS